VRDQFLEEYFLPLRREFEKRIGDYEKLFPIKRDKLVETEVESIFAYEHVVSEKKI